MLTLRHVFPRALPSPGCEGKLCKGLVGAVPQLAVSVPLDAAVGARPIDARPREALARRVPLRLHKRPTPADLFRTLEEASGVDLDWFWL